MKLFLIGFCFFCQVPVLNAATFSFVYTDPNDSGFYDNTPVTPLADNTGTTLGEQRRNVLEFAASIWANYIESNIPITVSADFKTMGGTATRATLAGARARFTGTSSPGSELLQNVWYPLALANSLVDRDLSPANYDISVTVNESIDSDPGVFRGAGYYYGYDGGAGSQVDLLATLLHELGHGLGFSSLVSPSNGSTPRGFYDVFSRQIFDEETAKPWVDMTDTERFNSARNDPHLVFNGPAVTQASLRVLKPDSLGEAQVVVLSPAASAMTLDAEQARFGLSYPQWGISGEIVLVDDGVAPASDGCGGHFLNADELLGRIALVDRGNCGFVDKVKRAQDAGAIAVIVINNTTGLFSMTGGNPQVTIPSVFISQTDGAFLKALPSGATVRLENKDTALLDKTQNGKVRLHAPAAYRNGSSVSHWSRREAGSYLLMEPNIGRSLLPELDLTIMFLRDIGWNVKNVNIPYLNYGLWAQEMIPGAFSAPNQDADLDGWDNFSEYVFGSLPQNASSVPSSLVIGSASAVDRVNVGYIRNKLAGDVIYSLESTDDLSQLFQPTSFAGFIIEQTTALDATNSQIDIKADAGGSIDFFRINVETYTP